MILILLCKKYSNSILKQVLYQMDEEKYMRFTINYKLSFIDSFQLLSSSSARLVKVLNKDDFKYFSQEFDKKRIRSS